MEREKTEEVWLNGQVHGLVWAWVSMRSEGVLKLLCDLPFGGLHVFGVVPGFAEELEPEEDLRIELRPGDVGRKCELEPGGKVLVDFVGSVKVCCKGEKGGGNDGDVDRYCTQTAFEGPCKMFGEWIG